jgi:type II secretory pathway pseudopilin PulG
MQTTFHARARRSGFTIVEMLVGAAISSFVVMAVAGLTFYSARSFSALSNYVELDAASRAALDSMTQEIRQANYMASWSPTQLVFNVPSGTLTYTYDPRQRTLTRSMTDQRDKVLLTECDFLQFSIFQRSPIGGSFESFGVATPGTCKVVQLHWVCSRKLLGEKVNTESVQSAKIVIRKQ